MREPVFNLLNDRYAFYCQVNQHHRDPGFLIDSQCEVTPLDSGFHI